MVDIDAAGVATVSESGIEIERVPEGIVFEPLVDHERLGTLVGWDEKFAAHNAAAWQHGLLVHVPKGVVLEQPLYVRIAATVPDASLFWRLLVIAGGLALQPDRGVRLRLARPRCVLERRRRALRRAGREARVRLAPEPLAGDVALRDAPRARRARRRARLGRGGFGSKKGKIRIQNDLAGQGATSRVTGAYFADGAQHLDYDTFQEHIAPNTTSDFAFKGALRDKATAVWRGMIRVEPDAQKTNAYQENRNLLLSPDAHADSIPGLEILANDVRCTHGATLGQVDREQLFYLMARGLSAARPSG